MSEIDLSKIIFGTDGWRGLLDEELNEDSVAIVAQAFADYLHSLKEDETKKVVVAYDGRKNSELFANIIAEVLSGNDIEIFLADKIEPTPILSYFIKEYQLLAGIMVTASHNPAKYNGVKFKANYAGPFFTEETLKVESFLGKSPVKKSTELINVVDIRNVYLRHLDLIIDFNSIKRSNITALIDSMAGAGQEILKNLLIKHGIGCEAIYSTAKNDFDGRLAEPIEKNLQPLKNELAKSEYSLGVATDGDADRVGVMLENGDWLSTQETIFYLADYILNVKHWRGSLVKTSSVTDKLKIIARNNDVDVHDVQVGFKYICEKMVNENAVFGAEESGGFGYKVNMPERDGIFSSLMIMEMLSKSGFNKLSDFVNAKRKQYGEVHYSRIDKEYTKEDKNTILPKLFRNIPIAINHFKVIDFKGFYSSRKVINGIKFILDSSPRWLLLRVSETEPLIRIYAEGKSDEEVVSLLNSGLKFFNLQQENKCQEVS